MKSKTDSKPRVFIGSSVEHLNAAHSVRTSLDYEFEVTVWDQDIFKPSDYTLEALVRELKKTDFCIFILAPDDKITLRGRQYQVARDNVIFELGLSVGIIGRERTFLMQPRNQNKFHIPTDLLGLTPATYDAARSDENLIRALGDASFRVKLQMQELDQAERLSAKNPKPELGRGFMYHESGRVPLEITLDLMTKAKSSVTVLGSTLRAFVARFTSEEDSRFMDHVKKLLSDGVNFNFVLMDPESEIVQNYARDRKVPNQIKETRDTIAIFKGLMKEFRQYEGRAEVRSYSRIPFSYVLMIDPENENGGMLFNHYLPATKKANCPYIRLFKSTHPDAFQRYYSAVEDVMKLSKKLFGSRGKERAKKDARTSR